MALLDQRDLDRLAALARVENAHLAVVAAGDEHVRVLRIELDADEWRDGLEGHLGPVRVLHVPDVRVDAAGLVAAAAALLELQVAVGGGELARPVHVPGDVVGGALERVRVAEHVDGLGRGHLVHLLRVHFVEVQLVDVDGVVLFDHVLDSLGHNTNSVFSNYMWFVFVTVNSQNQ